MKDKNPFDTTELEKEIEEEVNSLILGAEQKSGEKFPLKWGILFKEIFVGYGKHRSEKERRRCAEEVEKAIDGIFTFDGRDVSDKNVTISKSRLRKELGLTSEVLE